MLWITALLGTCDVIQEGWHLSRHLGSHSKRETIKNRRKVKLLDARHVECDIIVQFSTFCAFFTDKKGEKLVFAFKKCVTVTVNGRCWWKVGFKNSRKTDGGPLYIRGLTYCNFSLMNNLVPVTKTCHMRVISNMKEMMRGKPSQSVIVPCFLVCLLI